MTNFDVEAAAAIAAMSAQMGDLSSQQDNFVKPPTEYELTPTPTSGLIAHPEGFIFYKDLFKEVTVKGAFVKPAGVKVINGATIGALPATYRPIKQNRNNCESATFHDGSTAINVPLLVTVDSGGSIRVWGENIPSAPPGDIYFTSSFLSE